MTISKYDVFYRSELVTDGDWKTLPEFDLFVSSFNKSERLRTVYDKIEATRKIWLIHPEYSFLAEELPDEDSFCPSSADEAGDIRGLFDKLISEGAFTSGVTRLCVDITGMMRPHILYLLIFLHHLGHKQTSFIYAEPMRYVAKEKTAFAVGQISEVRAVRGFEGSPNISRANDVLIIGMGFDDRMIREVAEDKDNAKKIQLYGLPPLRADMYQQSVIRGRKAADAVADPDFSERNRASAPAGDPFATAAVLENLVARTSQLKPITNLYLSPVGTKAQTLGFGLYFIGDCLGGNASITFPFSEGYTSETSVGFYKAWIYSVDFGA